MAQARCPDTTAGDKRWRDSLVMLKEAFEVPDVGDADIHLN
jgi:hypothetical protein